LKTINESINKAISEQGKLKQEKLRYSLIRKANENTLQKYYDTRTTASQVLTAIQIEQMENEITVHGEKLQ
jgi:hypothetical protein